MTNRDIVVIGASAGGMAVLKQIVQDLPPDLPAAVFIAIHRTKTAYQLLPELIAGASRLPVAEPAQREPIVPGRIYIAPPDHHMLLMVDGIHLSRGPRENMTRPAVDPLFRSAAVAFGPRVIAVVLSGELDDGTAGLDAVKRCGGIAVVQDPADAASPSMPRSALRHVAVEHQAAAAALGGLIAGLARQRAGNPVPIPADIRLEVAIAARPASTADDILSFATPSTFSCPICKGVMSSVEDGKPLRFRCQVGHAFTALGLAQAHTEETEEALSIALRVLEERRKLVERLAQEAREAGRSEMAALYEPRMAEYGRHAEVIRNVLLKVLDSDDREDGEEGEAAVGD